MANNVNERVVEILESYVRSNVTVAQDIAIFMPQHARLAGQTVRLVEYANNPKNNDYLVRVYWTDLIDTKFSTYEIIPALFILQVRENMTYEEKYAPKKYQWAITIWPREGHPRLYELDHEYATEQEAEREAEHIADREFTESDEEWTLSKLHKPNA